MDAYSIVSGGKAETKVTNDITYLTESGLDEFRETTSKNKVLFSLNKLKLSFKPKVDIDISYDALIKTSTGSALQQLLSQTPEELHQTSSMEDPKSLYFSQYLEINKQFSYKHTSTISAKYRYQDSKNKNDWLFDRPVFSGIIPFLQKGDIYNLLQKSSSHSQSGGLNFKHYWVLDNLHHLYPKAGIDFLDQSYSTFDYQQLPDGDMNSFQDSGFNNDLNFRFFDTYAGLEFKMKKGDLIIKPGLTAHFYRWQVSQFSKEIVHSYKSTLLPALMLKYEINASENLNFNYNLKSGFSDASSYSNRLRLVSFNRLFRGNETLENRLSHALSLRYSKFNMYHGIFINGSINYTRKVNSIRSTNIIEGIDQISSLVYTSVPEDSYFGNASIAKQTRKLKFTLSGNASLSSYSRIINNESIDYNSQNYSYTLKTETRFKKLPNFEVGYRQDFSIFESNNFSNRFTQVEPFAILDYDFLKDFILKADYSYHYYQNKGNNKSNRFALGNASLFYNKEDRPWSFEIDVKNAFDVRYKNSNSLSEYLITDQRTYIQPRTVLFKISYKL